MASMTLYVFESWMMSLDIHFKSQKRKVFFNMNNTATHSLSMLVRVNHLVFETCALTILVLLSYHLMFTYVAQSLDHGISVSFGLV